MKRNAVKSFSAVVLVLILMFTSMCTCYAETIQDRLEAWIEEAVEDYQNADTEEEMASIQDEVNNFIEESGLDDIDIDLSQIADTDIGQIVDKLIGEDSFIGSLSSLASDAWSSGFAMIQDVFSQGLGTSDGSNTATTKEAQTSPNVIIADATTGESYTQAVGISVNMPSTTAVSTTNAAEITTYDVGETTAANIIGSGVTTTVENTTIATDNVSDDGIPVSSVAVFVILSVATLAVIVAIVIFFVLKRK